MEEGELKLLSDFFTNSFAKKQSHTEREIQQIVDESNTILAEYRSLKRIANKHGVTEWDMEKAQLLKALQLSEQRVFILAAGVLSMVLLSGIVFISLERMERVRALQFPSPAAQINDR